MVAIDVYGPLIAQIQKASPDISGEALAYFKSGLRIKSYSQKKIIIEAGKKQPYLAFINSGFVRSFYVDDLGKERNNRFLSSGEFITHYSALINNKPSKYNFQAMEQVETILFTKEHMDMCYKLFPQFERYGRMVAEHVFIKYEEHLESFLFQTPEERYVSFLQNNSGIIQKISLTQLSSYLGIDRVSLSRIRKRLTRK